MFGATVIVHAVGLSFPAKDLQDLLVSRPLTAPSVKRVICGHQYTAKHTFHVQIGLPPKCLITFIGHDCNFGTWEGGTWWRKHPKVYPKIFPLSVLEMCAFGDVESPFHVLWHLGIFPKHGIESWVHNDFPKPLKKHQGINK